MNAEERVSAAAEATTASIRQIRPLTLPDSSAVSAEPRAARRRRFKETWLIPLGAAAAVVAVALSLVTFRLVAAPTKSSTAAPGVTGIPRYYAIATEGPFEHNETAVINVAINDVRTGETIATVTLPPVDVAAGLNATVGVSATPDDRSFVVGGRNVYGAIHYYLVHIAPGTKQVATFESLPIPEVEVGTMLGFAVSPDGKELAVMSARGNGTTLRIYSIESGATLRTWTAGTWKNQSNGQVLTTGVSWTANGRQVGFSVASTPSGGLVERLISATAPGDDLATASKVVLKAPGNCSSLLLTPEGGTVVCATGSHPPVGSLGECGGNNGPMFAAYSATTGKLLRVLYQYMGTCVSGTNTVLWTDDSAQHVIGERDITFQDNPLHYTDGYGVAAAGQFTDIPVRLTGQWYSGPAF